MELDEQKLNRVEVQNLGHILYYLIMDDIGFGVILHLRAVLLAEDACGGIGLGMKAETEGFIKGFPQAGPGNAGLKNGFLCMGIIDQRAVGGDGVAAGAGEAKLFHLMYCAVQRTSGGHDDGVSKLDSLSDSLQVFRGDFFGIGQECSIQIDKQNLFFHNQRYSSFSLFRTGFSWIIIACAPSFWEV